MWPYGFRKNILRAKYMDKSCLDYTVDIINAIKWPVAVSFIACFFRTPLSSLLQRIKIIRRKDSVVELNEISMNINMPTMAYTTYC